MPLFCLSANHLARVTFRVSPNHHLCTLDLGPKPAPDAARFCFAYLRLEVLPPAVVAESVAAVHDRRPVSLHIRAADLTCHQVCHVAEAASRQGGRGRALKM